MFLPAMEGGTFPFCVIRHEAIKEDSALGRVFVYCHVYTCSRHL